MKKGSCSPPKESVRTKSKNNNKVNIGLPEFRQIITNKIVRKLHIIINKMQSVQD